MRPAWSRTRHDETLCVTRGSTWLTSISNLDCCHLARGSVGTFPSVPIRQPAGPRGVFPGRKKTFGLRLLAPGASLLSPRHDRPTPRVSDRGQAAPRPDGPLALLRQG